MGFPEVAGGRWLVAGGSAVTAPALHPALSSTRATLHRIAAHVLARRRYEEGGRFGLRAGPGGIATPAFGEGPEVIRIAGVTVVHENAGDASYTEVNGATLTELAAVVGADLAVPFSVGPESPEVGNPDAVLDLDRGATELIALWFDLAWRALDTLVATLPATSRPATIQLWPEHFDAATHVALSSGERVNLGFSPGDAFETMPYVYVGPWSQARPGDPAFWNAPFGAALRWDQVQETSDPRATCVEFLATGLRHANVGSIATRCSSDKPQRTE